MTTRALALPMTLAVQNFDRSAALVNRTVTIENVTVLAVPPGTPGVLGVFTGAMDAAEVPVARYLSWKDRGEPLTAIPVFPDRLMLHQYIYARADAGVKGLADLRGKRVVTPGYYITASFWQREFLREAGVQPEEVQWVTTSPEAEPEHMPFPSGVNVSFEPGGNRLGVNHLLDGRAECAMTEGTLPVPPDQSDKIVRVIDDVHAVQRDWYAKTRFFPAVHVIVVREAALKARPQLGAEICQAYDQARAIAYRQIQNERMTSVPFMRGFADEMMELCGDDPWPYGVERNRAELEVLLGLAHGDGYTKRRLSVDELFDPESAKYEFVSRMVTAGAVGG